MKISRWFIAVVALVISSLAIGGCAADAENTGDETQQAPEVKTDEVDTEQAHYVPKVTRTDIVEGGGTCAGNFCTINGRDWDCGGGGLCSLIAR